MAKEKKVGTLKPGNPFRDWLVDVLGERAPDKKCRVEVYKIIPSSHTVCRYELQNQGLSVVGKFYGEPTGWKRNYDPIQAMYKEYETLKKVENIIDIPRPLAIRKSFHCVLLTEYIQGKSLYEYMRQDYGLYDRLISIAQVLRKLHHQTKSDYKIEREFASYHKVLNQIGLDMSSRRTFDRLLGDWWYSQRLARPYGCRVHHDANPTNYLFDQGKVYALDFESSRENANFVHDLGIVAAELKHYFAVHRGDASRAEPYIGHFLWHYSRSESEFYAITRILPFFMSLGMLRIARLGISPDVRAKILQEARACLEGGLKMA